MGLLSKQHSSYLTLHSTPCLYGSSPAFEVVILRRSIQPGYENVCTGLLIGMLHDRSTTRTDHYYIVCYARAPGELTKHTRYHAGFSCTSGSIHNQLQHYAE